MQIKTCNRCHIGKPPSEFYRRSCGYVFPNCKSCYNAQTLRTRDNEAYREQRRLYLRSSRNSDAALARERRHALKFRTQYPEKAAAQKAVKAAITRGTLVRPIVCERCNEIPPPLRDGRPAIHGHHADYSKPLAVAWMCTLCHSNEHRALEVPNE